MNSDRSLVFTFSVFAFLVTSAYSMSYFAMLKRQSAYYAPNNLKRLAIAIAKYEGRDCPTPDFYYAQYRLKSDIVADLFLPALWLDRKLRPEYWRGRKRHVLTENWTRPRLLQQAAWGH